MRRLQKTTARVPSIIQSNSNISKRQKRCLATFCPVKLWTLAVFLFVSRLFIIWLCSNFLLLLCVAPAFLIFFLLCLEQGNYCHLWHSVPIRGPLPCQVRQGQKNVSGPLRPVRSCDPCAESAKTWAGQKGRWQAMETRRRCARRGCTVGCLWTATGWGLCGGQGAPFSWRRTSNRDFQEECSPELD